MSDRRTAARRRTAIATTLSVAGHAVVVLLIALDLDRGSEEPAFAPPVEVTLTPFEERRNRPPPEPPAKTPERAPPPASPPRPRRVIPQGALPSALVAPYDAPAPPSASAAAPAAPDLPTALRTGCVGKRGMEVEARVDCKLEIWSVLDGKPRRDLPGDTIPDDKQAKWDVVARQQARQRRGVRPGGNASTIDCPHGNLGAGCLSEMLIPLTGSAAKK